MKVLLIDDHALFRAGLKLLLESMDDGYTVLEAADSHSAFDLIKRTPGLELILLDLALPGMPGLEALSLLRKHHPTLPVVVISASDDPPSVLDAINRGAMGFIPKSSDGIQLKNALRLVLAKSVYVPLSALAAPLGASGAPPKPAIEGRGNALRDLGMSAREIEVLALVVQGLPNKLIARQLGIAEPTVKSHVAAGLRALNVDNRTQAVLAVARLKYAFP